MKKRVQDLEGVALDWAVATALGYKMISDGISLLVEKGATLKILGPSICNGKQVGFSPSTDWLQGGPLIEEVRIAVGDSIHPNLDWTATLYVPDEEPWQFDGPTPLIATMRCLVASKLGDEINVPDTLLEGQP